MHLNLKMKGLIATGALLASGLGSSAIFATPPAAASPARAAAITTSTTSATTTSTTPSPPSIVTSSFACSNGKCAIGPGDVGMSFAAGLIGTGGPPYYGPEGKPYLMKGVSGS